MFANVTDESESETTDDADDADDDDDDAEDDDDDAEDDAEDAKDAEETEAATEDVDPSADTGLGDAFVKSEVLARHRHDRENYHELGPDVRLLVTKTPFSPPDLSKLHPISLRDLQPNNVHHGRVIYGTLCADPLVAFGVLEPVEDPGLAVKVAIYDASPDWRRRYAAGTKLAIKQPLLEGYGTPHLTVDPGCVEEVAAFPGTAAAAPLHPVAAILDNANRSMELGNWSKAIGLYEQAMCDGKAGNHGDKAGKGGGDGDDKVGKVDGGHGDGKDGDHGGDELEAPKVAALLPAFYNRAEAYLNNGDFDHALADANKALAIDYKSICCKAKALQGMQEFEKAVAWIEKGLEMIRCEELEEMLEPCKACDRQSKTGEYREIDVFLQVREVAPKCADFVGPVKLLEVDVDYTDRGAGLFASKDVKVGEVLIVSNALAVCPNFSRAAFADEQAKILMDAGIWQGKTSSRVSSQLKLFLDLAIGSEKSDNVFRSNNGLVPENLLSCGDRRLFPIDSFNEEIPFSTLECCGIWLLPSLIRHACISNVSLLQIGSVMFVHAARDIKAGEELFVSYFDPFHPQQQRRSCSIARGFLCRRKRCMLETSLKNCLRDVENRYDEAMTKLHARAADGFIGSCTALLERKIQAIQCNESNESWVRASYAPLYLGSISRRSGCSAVRSC